MYTFPHLPRDVLWSARPSSSPKQVLTSGLCSGVPAGHFGWLRDGRRVWAGQGLVHVAVAGTCGCAMVQRGGAWIPASSKLQSGSPGLCTEGEQTRSSWGHRGSLKPSSHCSCLNQTGSEGAQGPAASLSPAFHGDVTCAAPCQSTAGNVGAA